VNDATPTTIFQGLLNRLPVRRLLLSAALSAGASAAQARELTTQAEPATQPAQIDQLQNTRMGPYQLAEGDRYAQAAPVRTAQVSTPAQVNTPPVGQATPVQATPVQAAPVQVTPVQSTPVAPVSTPAPTTPVTVAPVTAPVTVTLTDVPADHWARQAIKVLLAKGLLKGYPDGSFQGNKPISRYEAATIFAKLLDSGALQGAGLNSADMTVVARGLAEVADQVMDVSRRLGTVEAQSASREARMLHIEQQVVQMTTLLASVVPDPAASGRLNAVESAVQALPGVLVGKATVEDLTALRTSNDALTAQLSALTAREQALEDRLTALQAEKAVQATLPAAFPEPVPAPPEGPKRFSATVGGTGTVTASGLRYGVEAGLSVGHVLGPVGAQVEVFSRPSAQAIGASVAVNASFNAAGLEPYVGAGAGIVLSPSRADVTTKTSDTFALALVGVNYPLNDSLGLYAQGDARYFFSSKGYGTGLETQAGSTQGGVGVGFKVGMRFSF